MPGQQQQTTDPWAVVSTTAAPPATTDPWAVKSSSQEQKPQPSPAQPQDAGFLHGLWNTTLGPVWEQAKAEKEDIDNSSSFAEKLQKSVSHALKNSPPAMLPQLVSNALHGAYQQGKQAAQSAYQSGQEIGEAVKAARAGAPSSEVKGHAKAAAGLGLETAGRSLAAQLPVLGPGAAQAGEKIGEGRTGEGLGEAAGLIGQVLLADLLKIPGERGGPAAASTKAAAAEVAPKALTDTDFFAQARQEVAGGKPFGDLSVAEQSKVAQRAQELKAEYAAKPKEPATTPKDVKTFVQDMDKPRPKGAVAEKWDEARKAVRTVTGTDTPEGTVDALQKSIRPEPAGMDEFRSNVANEFGRVQKFAEDNKLSLRTRRDFSKVSRAAADAQKKLFDEQLQPLVADEEFKAPGGYQGATTGEGAATGDQMLKRLTQINKELSPKYRQALQSKVEAGLVKVEDLQAEAAAIRESLYPRIAELSGWPEEAVQNLRQSMGRLYDLSDEVELSTNKAINAAGAESQTGSAGMAHSKVGVASKVINKVRGGEEAIANRQFRKATDKAPKFPVPETPPIEPRRYAKLEESLDKWSSKPVPQNTANTIFDQIIDFRKALKSGKVADAEAARMLKKISDFNNQVRAQNSATQAASKLSTPEKPMFNVQTTPPEEAAAYRELVKKRGSDRAAARKAKQQSDAERRASNLMAHGNYEE